MWKALDNAWLNRAGTIVFLVGAVQTGVRFVMGLSLNVIGVALLAVGVALMLGPRLFKWERKGDERAPIDGADRQIELGRRAIRVAGLAREDAQRGLDYFLTHRGGEWHELLDDLQAEGKLPQRDRSLLDVSVNVTGLTTGDGAGQVESIGRRLLRENGIDPGSVSHREAAGREDSPGSSATRNAVVGGSQVVIYKSVAQLRNEGQSLSQGRNSGIMLNSFSAQLEMRLSKWTKEVKDALTREGASDHQVKLFLDAGKPVAVSQGLNVALGAPYELSQKLNVLNAYLE